MTERPTDPLEPSDPDAIEEEPEQPSDPTEIEQPETFPGRPDRQESSTARDATQVRILAQDV
jgi:hypothetical protein